MIGSAIVIVAMLPVCLTNIDSTTIVDGRKIASISVSADASRVIVQMQDGKLLFPDLAAQKAEDIKAQLEKRLERCGKK